MTVCELHFGCITYCNVTLGGDTQHVTLKFFFPRLAAFSDLPRRNPTWPRLIVAASLRIQGNLIGKVIVAPFVAKSRSTARIEEEVTRSSSSRS
jgi:hypothetical protein